MGTKIDYQFRKDEDGYDIGCDRCGTSECMTAPFELTKFAKDARENNEAVTIDGKDYQYYCPFCAETTAIGSVLEYRSLYNTPGSQKDTAKALAQGFNVLFRMLKEKV